MPISTFFLHRRAPTSIALVYNEAPPFPFPVINLHPSLTLLPIQLEAIIGPFSCEASKTAQVATNSSFFSLTYTEVNHTSPTPFQDEVCRHSRCRRLCCRPEPQPRWYPRVCCRCSSMEDYLQRRLTCIPISSSPAFGMALPPSTALMRLALATLRSSQNLSAPSVLA